MATAGDEIRCDVRASDGIGLSGAAKSNEVVLNNTAPSGGSVLLGPPGAAEGDTLTCTASDATDPDGDAIDWVYTLTVNDEVVEGETGPELTSEHFDKGDVVGCEAAPTDGTGEGEPVASKTSVVIQNTLPGVLQVTLTPLTVTKLEILTCAYEGWSDPDPADTEATVVWSWWRAFEDGTE